MLNRAHALHRQAEKATRKGNFDEAVKYHKEAADLLNQLLENILEEKFAESIRLQAQLHEKEKTILRNQKKKAEKAHQESLIRNMSDNEVPDMKMKKCNQESQLKVSPIQFASTPMPPLIISHERRILSKSSARNFFI